MSYEIKTGDTIATVTQKLNSNFRELYRKNPKSFGRTKNGRWFLREGHRLHSPGHVKSASATPACHDMEDSKPSVSTLPAQGEYKVQPGDTIAKITGELGLSFQELKDLNPGAVGRAANGNWFFHAGANLRVPGDFRQAMAHAAEQAANPILPVETVKEHAPIQSGLITPEGSIHHIKLTTKPHREKIDHEAEDHAAAGKKTQGDFLRGVQPAFGTTGTEREPDGPAIHEKNPQLGGIVVGLKYIF